MKEILSLTILDCLNFEKKLNFRVKCRQFSPSSPDFVQNYKFGHVLVQRYREVFCRVATYTKNLTSSFEC